MPRDGTPQVGVAGHIDVFHDGALHGWCLGAGGRPIVVEVDGRFAGVARASLDRPDVTAAGHADESCGFAFPVPAEFVDGAEHDVVFRVPGDPSPGQIESRVRLAGEPSVAPPPATRAAVVCWDLGHNPAGRAVVLVRLLERLYGTVDLIGPLYPRFGGTVWPPLAGDDTLSIRHARVGRFADLEQLAEDICQTRYDLVYICKPRWPGLYLGYRLARASDCPVALDIDDRELAFFPPADAGREPDPVAVLRKIETDAVAAHDGEATALAEALIDCFPTLTVSNVSLRHRFGGTVIRHARSAEAFDPARVDRVAERRRLGYGATHRVALFVGTVRRHKGVVRLADALAQLGDPAIRLCVVGPCDDPDIRRDLRRALGDAVAFHEGVPFANLPQLVAAADLVCLPQDPAAPPAAWQIPAKLSDALAMGVPVILERLPPVADLEGRPGIILRDDGPLHRQIRDILDRPPSPKAVRDTFLTEFSLPVVAERLAGALADLPPLDSKADRILRKALVGERSPIARPLRLAAPVALRRPGRDVVFLWKQNDSGLFGRRPDMIAKYLPACGGAGRIIQFDASVSLNTVKRLAEGAGTRLLSDAMVHNNIVARWLGLCDDLAVRRHTFVYDDHGRSFMGQPLPRRADLTEQFYRVLRSHAVSEEALLWVCPAAFDFDDVLAAHRFPCIVTDLIDDQRSFDSSPLHRAQLQDNYEIVLAASDAVIANCPGIAERFRPMIRSPLHVVANAAERHRPGQVEPLDPFPGEDVVRIGYAGNLRDRIDVALIERLARSDPRYRLVLVGPTGGNREIERLGRLRNVTLTGPLRYEDANRVISSFDIAIMPHLRTPLTDTMSPLKLYLYQALGLPIVTTAVANLEDATGAVHIAGDHDAFVDAVGALARRGGGRSPSAGATVYWDEAVTRIARILDEVTTAGSVPAAPADAPGAR